MAPPAPSPPRAAAAEAAPLRRCASAQARARPQASSSHINKWDDLFQTLTRPDDLRAYLTSNLSSGASDSPQQTTLRTQVELLTGTLQVDLSLLKVSEVAESFIMPME